MPQLLFANNASTTLAVAISSSATTLNVAAGTGALFPSPGPGQYFKITLYPASGSTPAPEVMNVTAVSSDTFTVVRGQEGTTAAAWGVSSIVDNVITRDQLVQFGQVIPFAGNPNTYVAGQAGDSRSAPVFVWDYTNQLLYICTTSGSTSSAVWSEYYPGANFTPVQQGGGAGQTNNKVYIGWTASASGLKAQVDSTDLGFLATQSYVGTEVAAAVAPLAPINSPSFSGTPIYNVSISPSDNSALLANTNFVYASVSYEATVRANADTTLQGNINAEATARSNADTTLQSNINAEATTRYNADNTLQGNINAEATARANADALLFPYAGGVISGAVTISGGPLEVSGATGTTASGWQMNPSGTGAFSAGVTQSIHTSNDIVADRFIAASDGRIKSEIDLISIEDALRFLAICKPRTYVKHGQWDAGFIAQEVLAAGWQKLVVISDETKLSPDGVVLREPDERLKASFNGFDGPEGKMYHLKESGVPAILATVLEHHVQQIALLKEQLSVLKAEISGLKNAQGAAP